MGDALVRADQTDFLNRLQAITEPYEVDVDGVQLTLLPGVFPPTTDTRLLASHIHAKRGDRFLDLTCGSGSLAVIAGLQGATGIANDLNPTAAQNARENIARHGVGFKVTEGDLYSNVPEEPFDYIVSNGPYIEGVVQDPLELAFFGARQYVIGLFKGAESRLARGGKMLITFAEFGDTEFFEATALENGFSHEVIDSATSSDGQRVYRLYELSRVEQ
jgi:methylase of polypeptide subunit release factors